MNGKEIISVLYPLFFAFYFPLEKGYDRKARVQLLPTHFFFQLRDFFCEGYGFISFGKKTGFSLFTRSSRHPRRDGDSRGLSLLGWRAAVAAVQLLLLL